MGGLRLPMAGQAAAAGGRNALNLLQPGVGLQLRLQHILQPFCTVQPCQVIPKNTSHDPTRAVHADGSGTCRVCVTRESRFAPLQSGSAWFGGTTLGWCFMAGVAMLLCGISRRSPLAFVEIIAEKRCCFVAVSSSGGLSQRGTPLWRNMGRTCS